VADTGAVDFEFRKDRGVLVAVRHGVKLRLFQVWGKVDCKLGIDVDEHELVGDVVSEVGKVREGGSDFRKISNCNWTFNAQTIGFEEDSFLFQPGKKMPFRTAKFDVAKALV